VAVDEYYQRYADQGYVFSDEILTRYAISLATKPFVILSGISGTGKTKIAQLFEVPGLPGSRGASEDNEREQGDPPAARRDYILLTVTDGLINHDGRANLAFADLPAVLETGEVEELKRQIEEKRAANDGGNICEPKLISVEAPDGTELTIGLYLQRASSPLVRLRVKSRRGGPEPEYDCQAYFRENFEVGDVLKLEKVGRHRLQIVEINNEKVVAERRAQVQERFQEIENKCFIAVKSSWTDPSELFGYYNPLTQKYCLTKFLRFLLMAKDYPEMPFFVILDEMNLARVEHYFSDFLSCMESRVVLQDGTVKQEGVHLHSGSNLIETDDDEYEEIPGTIEIPLNLYVTGTVNIDDTTYMFSPKVLDRANVIEFNEVYLEQSQASAGERLSSWPNFDKYKKSDFRMFDALEQRSKDDIGGVLSVLKKYNMHFGYRTIAEIAHFILNSKELIGEGQRVEEFALDVQILQKILPKFHGSYAKLHDVLRELIFFLSGSEGNLDDFDLTQIRAIDLEASRFKRSLEKLQKMYETLVSQGFASFIE
jgi:prepilin-type processing-associated H-X9-DG protein